MCCYFTWLQCEQDVANVDVDAAVANVITAEASVGLVLDCEQDCIVADEATVVGAQDVTTVANKFDGLVVKCANVTLADEEAFSVAEQISTVPLTVLANAIVAVALHCGALRVHTSLVVARTVDLFDAVRTVVQSVGRTGAAHFALSAGKRQVTVQTSPATFGSGLEHACAGIINLIIATLARIGASAGAFHDTVLARTLTCLRSGNSQFETTTTSVVNPNFSIFQTKCCVLDTVVVRILKGKFDCSPLHPGKAADVLKVDRSTVDVFGDEFASVGDESDCAGRKVFFVDVTMTLRHIRRAYRSRARQHRRGHPRKTR